MDKNDNVAKWALIGCATFMLLIQTFASSIAVIGYDDVIRAYADRAALEITNSTQNKDDLLAIKNALVVLQKELVTQKVDNIIRFEKLELNSHAKSNK
jgi:hypothetical protein